MPGTPATARETRPASALLDLGAQALFLLA
jgi:hypothetical protein